MNLKLPSPALVIACLALFVAIGGTGYAAGTLANGAARSTGHGKNKTKPKRGPRGPKGAAGPTGANGAAGAAGKEGAPGRNLTAETPLTPGQTETGVFSAAGSGAPGYLAGVFTFVQPLSKGLEEDHTVTLAAGEASAPHCPGVGQAEAGYLCVYPTEEGNVAIDQYPEDPGTGQSGTGKDGAQGYWTISASGTPSFVYGTWALTAP